MLDNITPFNELVEESKVIDAYLQMTMSEDANEAIIRGNDIAVHLSRTGKMLADAKYHLNIKMQTDIMQMLTNVAKTTPFATARTVNALTDSLCRDERFLVDWVGRLNASCTHQLDWLRTVVSKAKADQYASRGMNQ
jgi:hypothetical protein